MAIITTILLFVMWALISPRCDADAQSLPFRESHGTTGTLSPLGDGSAIYRPQGRINTAGALRGMVDYCSTELNLQLFPEDVTAVAAVLQRDHYRFGLPARAGAGGR